jgi:glycerol uptake facilitator protein
MSPYLAEFFGTLLIVLLIDGVVAGVILKGTKSENAGWLSICLACGLAVALAIYAVGAHSGAHLNPAVTIALASIGKFNWSMVAGYCLAQVAGAFVGAVLVWLHYQPHFNATESKSVKLAVFCTGPAIRSTVSNFISEALGTALLVLAILFIGVNSFTEGLMPLVVGALIVSIGLSLGGTTGFAINPARDFGPRLAHYVLPIHGKGDSDWRYSWIPIAAPIAGGLTGAWLFTWLFA